MIRSLWIARTGIDAQQTSLEVIANNLANTSTNGFKRQRPVFQDLLYQTVRQAGAQSSQSTQIPSGLQIGTGVTPVSTVTNFTEGALEQTSNPLDVAVNGQGFFVSIAAGRYLKRAIASFIKRYFANISSFFQCICS